MPSADKAENKLKLTLRNKTKRKKGNYEVYLSVNKKLIIKTQ